MRAAWRGSWGRRGVQAAWETVGGARHLLAGEGNCPDSAHCDVCVHATLTLTLWSRIEECGWPARRRPVARRARGCARSAPAIDGISDAIGPMDHISVDGSHLYTSSDP